MPPEFGRPIAAALIPAEGRTERPVATPEECAALARRFDIPGVAAFSAEVTLRPEPGGVIRATGRLHAEVTQTCVVTLEPVAQTVEEAVDLRFLPPGQEPGDEPDEPDEIPMEGHQLDLGEALAEQLALALDPYPRAPGAELPPLDGDGPSGPFAALARRGTA
jgi:uncharacterized metal-binding protein YceD (DUF177 family)